MKGFILLLLTFFIIPAQAGIVIYGTRVIYPAGKNEVMVQLMNRGDRGARYRRGSTTVILPLPGKYPRTFSYFTAGGARQSQYRAAA